MYSYLVFSTTHLGVCATPRCTPCWFSTSYSPPLPSPPLRGCSDIPIYCYFSTLSPGCEFHKCAKSVTHRNLDEETMSSDLARFMGFLGSFTVRTVIMGVFETNERWCSVRFVDVWMVNWPLWSFVKEDFKVRVLKNHFQLFWTVKWLISRVFPDTRVEKVPC